MKICLLCSIEGPPQSQPKLASKEYQNATVSSIANPMTTEVQIMVQERLKVSKFCQKHEDKKKFSAFLLLSNF